MHFCELQLFISIQFLLSQKDQFAGTNNYQLNIFRVDNFNIFYVIGCVFKNFVIFGKANENGNIFLCF